MGDASKGPKVPYGVHLDPDTLELLRRMAYWDRVTIAQIVEAALADYLEGKKYKPIPEGSRVRTGRPLGSKKSEG